MLRAAVLFFALMVLIPVLVAAPLFPAPLHLTRQVVDPISESTTVLNEYGYGNKFVAVRGARTSIADYEKAELIEIDREAGTYSITRFDVLAKANAAANLSVVREGQKPGAASRALRGIGARLTKAGRSAEFFEGDLEGEAIKQTIQVGVDRKVLISKEALEVLLGAAYPGVQQREHDVILSAAASSRRGIAADAAASPAAETAYALPVEQVTRYEVGGQQLEFRSSVVRVGNEHPPAELITIPAGARLTVSRIVAVQRELEQLDHPALIAPRMP